MSTRFENCTLWHGSRAFLFPAKSSSLGAVEKVPIAPGLCAVKVILSVGVLLQVAVRQCRSGKTRERLLLAQTGNSSRTTRRRLQCGSERRFPTTKRNGESFGAAIRNFTRRVCLSMSPLPLGDGSSRRNSRFCVGSPSKRAGCWDSPIRRRTREPSFRRPYAIWRICSSIPPRADVADFGAWQAPRGEGPSLPIEPCDGKSTRQRRSPSLYRSILWSGDRTCETPKS